MCGTKKIVRTMPNTPAMVGEGMTGVSYNEEFFSQEEKEEIEDDLRICYENLKRFYRQMAELNSAVLVSIY